MCVCLMPHIKNNFIIRNIKNIMNSNGKFNSSKIGTKMTRIMRNNIYNKFPYFIA